MTRRALVTGGSSGIGLATAQRLRDAGFAVTITGRDETALGRAADHLRGGASDVDAPSVSTLAFDVTDEEAVRAALDGERFDVVVNNAGAATAAPVVATALEDWEAMLAVNATGAFLVTRATLPAMLEADRGRIVFVASTSALSPGPYTAAYAASKHAMLGLARVVAAEVSWTKITANAVCPTFVDTPMTDRSIDRIVERTGRDRESAREALVAQTGLVKLVTPEEVAAAVAYLVSDDAAVMNGQILVLDGWRYV